MKQFEQIKEKEVIREIRNIWKRSKNKLKTESKDTRSILFASNSYMSTQTNEYPFSEDIIIFLTSKSSYTSFPILIYRLSFFKLKLGYTSLNKLSYQLPYIDLAT